MFILKKTHQEILEKKVREAHYFNTKEVESLNNRIAELRTKQDRELETAKYNYDTKLARAENEKKDTITYNAQKHKEEISRLKNDHAVQVSLLEGQYEWALNRAKAKADAREIELMNEVRIANNDAELTKSNAALTIERIEKDAESRIKTAEDAARVVLSNAQLEATHIVQAGKAKGEELSYQIAKAASEDIKDLYEDIIDTLTTKIPLEQINLTQVRDLITASTANFPKAVSGDVKVTNSNSK